MINQGLGLFTKFRPQMVQLAEQFVSRGSFHKHAELNRQYHDKIEARVTALEQKLERDKDEIIAAGEDRGNRIQDRINVAIEKLGEMRGELNQITRNTRK